MEARPSAPPAEPAGALAAQQPAGSDAAHSPRRSAESAVAQPTLAAPVPAQHPPQEQQEQHQQQQQQQQQQLVTPRSPLRHEKKQTPEPHRRQMSDKFMIFTYKIKLCKRADAHNWRLCPYAHPGEAGRRRPPHTYQPIMCDFSKMRKECSHGESCMLARNALEFWLHPEKYRTVMCGHGEGCTRSICFFAHNAQELRTPPASRLTEAGSELASLGESMQALALGQPQVVLAQATAGQAPTGASLSRGSSSSSLSGPRTVPAPADSPQVLVPVSPLLPYAGQPPGQGSVQGAAAGSSSVQLHRQQPAHQQQDCSAWPSGRQGPAQQHQQHPQQHPQLGGARGAGAGAALAFGGHGWGAGAGGGGFPQQQAPMLAPAMVPSSPWGLAPVDPSVAAQGYVLVGGQMLAMPQPPEHLMQALPLHPGAYAVHGGGLQPYSLPPPQPLFYPHLFQQQQPPSPPPQQQQQQQQQQAMMLAGGQPAAGAAAAPGRAATPGGGRPAGSHGSSGGSSSSSAGPSGGPAAGPSGRHSGPGGGWQ